MRRKTTGQTDRQDTQNNERVAVGTDASDANEKGPLIKRGKRVSQDYFFPSLNGGELWHLFQTRGITCEAPVIAASR